MQNTVGRRVALSQLIFVLALVAALTITVTIGAALIASTRPIATLSPARALARH